MKLKPKLIIGERPKGRIYFMSDLHYNHFNAIRHSSRPFSTLEEMNNYILETLSNTLTSDDYLFDLGDMFWKTPQLEIERVLKYIPCPFVKILGNHDNEKIWHNLFIVKEKSIIVADRVDVCIKDSEKDNLVVLDHYPSLSWNGRHHESWNIHGHCHGSVDELNFKSKEYRVDVGFDGKLAKEYGSFLIPWEKVKEKIKEIEAERIKENYEMIVL